MDVVLGVFTEAQAKVNSTEAAVLIFFGSLLTIALAAAIWKLLTSKA